MELLCLSSLEKVFFDGPTSRKERLNGSTLLKEKYSIQFAFYGSENFTYTIDSLDQDELSFFYVNQIPSMTPIKEKKDNHFLKGVPGFFPDLLTPVRETGEVTGTMYQWHSIWIEIYPKDFNNQRNRIINFKLSCDGNEQVSTFSLRVIPTLLPEQELRHTEWLHTDCLSDYYQVPIFSEHYWELVKNYISFAKKHGQNMILTPLFTPPLDTEVGNYRPVIQLVEVEIIDRTYRFDFSNLTKWANICKEVGIRYLEFSHLYSQWGADYAPHIVEKNGETIFGWHTSSISREYKNFLSLFIPELINWIKMSPFRNNVYFHLSDEPSNDSIERYEEISLFIKDLVQDYPIMDALSNYSFYQKKLIDIPVVATDHITPFLENRVPHLWAYYCSAQRDNVSNRFFDMPSYRTRIIGYQLFLNDIDGFLHWGFNFWYTQYSKKLVNPFVETDTGGAFASGDAFLVYPGEKGPLPSIRLKNIHYGIQDIQALEKLCELIGREQVKKILLNNMDEITFSDYPSEINWILDSREQINQLISQSI
ncbi:MULTISPECIES: DUF4091 domain-containing protein [Vagococcus]|uniref:DUF4091 domain-containing protein n=1 Tax=Vagococcus TaxID=2737 RepID=UPI002FC98EA1